MPVTDFMAWANALEDNRLPKIEGDITTLNTEVVALDQAHSDRLDLHDVQIGVAQADAQKADQAAAAVGQLQVEHHSELRGYIDQKIEQLRVSMQDKIDASVVAVTPDVVAEIGTQVSTAVSAVTGDLNQSVAAVESARAQIATNRAAIEATTQSVFDDVLPRLSTTTDQIDVQLPGISGKLSTLTAGYAFPSLAEGFDNISLSVNSLSSRVETNEGIVAASGVAGAGVIQNGHFPDQSTAWTTIGTAPQWINSVAYTAHKAAHWAVGAAVAGVSTDSDSSVWLGVADVEKYAVEVEWEQATGSLDGAGVRIVWINSVGAEYGAHLSLSQLEVSGSGPNKRIQGTGWLTRPDAFTGTFARVRVELYANGSIFSEPMSSKDITFHTLNLKPLTVTEASVTQTSAALASVQGQLAATYTISVQAGEGNEGRFEIVGWDGGSAIKLHADDIIADGTLNTRKLGVGFTTENLLPDPTFAQDFLHIKKAGTGRAFTEGHLRLRNDATWRPSFGPAVELYADQSQSVINDGSYLECQFFYGSADGNQEKHLDIVPEAFYEFSAQMACLSSHGAMYLTWYDENDNIISIELCGQEIPGDEITVGAGSSQVEALKWPRIGGIKKAPANAVKVVPSVRFVRGFGNTWSHVIAHSFTLRRAFSEDEKFAPFNYKGQTLIDGGQLISDSIESKHIAANTIGAKHLNTEDLKVSGLATFGGLLKSSNFDGVVDASGNVTDRGTQGFAMTQAGQGVFTNLIGRDDIQVGAVSEGVTYANYVEQTLSNNAEVLRVSLGEFMVGQFWQIACRIAWRSQGYIGFVDDDRYRRRSYSTGAKLQWRQRTGASWSNWSTLHIFPETTSTNWRSDDIVVPKQGIYDEVEVRIAVDNSLGTEHSAGNGTSASYANFDSVSLVARALVR